MKTIPYMQIRGGSSKGLYFKADDLPTNEEERNRILLIAMEGSTLGDIRQIDGLGGGTSLTSKVAIVNKSENPLTDLDYFFVQIVVGKGQVSTTQTCGNILAGVLHFAIESGMIEATHPTTTAKINIENTGAICEIVIQTPNGKIETQGSTIIDGVVGTAAPIICNYVNTVGSTCGALFPTGHTLDTINGIEVTLIDNGMPLVLMRAFDFGLQGNESKEILEANDDLKNKIEAIRLKAGVMMNLSDVKNQSIPKMCLVSKSETGGAINTRIFIPHVVHDAIGVLAAVSVATACIIPNTITHDLVEEKFDLNSKSNIQNSKISVEHPSGEFTVNLEYAINKNDIKMLKSGVIRTARILSKGVVYL